MNLSQNKKFDLYLALVHHPTLNKRGEKVCTSVTNLDIHDISRTCRTFGIKKYFLVTPLTLQVELIGRILNYWESDSASAYNPDRFDALSLATISPSLEDVREKITQLDPESRSPLVAATGANFRENIEISPLDFKRQCAELNRPGLIVFGTGWGLHPEALALCDRKLTSINGGAEDGYNHLSVRSAVAIYAHSLLEN
ncbi:MAG: RNA methyltransferase [Bacteriovoracaceae bacterium]|nr:RNA methyltransferase [Bacteriovoracaceae bacterium]